MGKSAVLATLVGDRRQRTPPRQPDPGETTRCQPYRVAFDGRECVRFIDTPGFSRPVEAMRAIQRIHGPGSPDLRRSRNFVRTPTTTSATRTARWGLCSPVPASSTSSIRRNLCATTSWRKWKSSAGPAAPGWPCSTAATTPPAPTKNRGAVASAPPSNLAPLLRRPPRPLPRTPAAAQGAVRDRGDTTAKAWRKRSTF